MPDVIRFGARYVPQHAAAVPVVQAVIAEARRRPFRTRGGALAFVTRRLREEGLTVTTICDARARARQRRVPASWQDGGTAA